MRQETRKAAGRRFVITVSLIAVTQLLFFAETSAAKKPPKSDPEPSLPPVRYKIRFYEVHSLPTISWTYGMNNRGQVGGYYITASGDTRAFLYDYAADPMVNPIGAGVDLNTLTFDTGYGVPTGWAIRNVAGINDAGDIVGNLLNVVSPEERRGYVLDMNRVDGNGDPLPPRLYTIPGEEYLPTTRTWCRCINEHGDVLGVYYTDDGSTFYYVINLGLYAHSTPYPMSLLEVPATGSFGSLSEVLYDGTTELGPVFVFNHEQGNVFYKFPWSDDPAQSAGANLTEMSVMNGLGTFAGRGEFEVPLNKNRTTTVSLDYIARLDGTFLTFDEDPNGVWGLNDNEDAILSDFGGRQNLHHSALHASYGLLSFDDMVEGVNDPATIELWASSPMFHLSKLATRKWVVDAQAIVAEDFPQVAGNMVLVDAKGTFLGTLGVVLTPVGYQQ